MPFATLKQKQRRAYEIAINESEKVINVLRLFYPLNIFPNKSSKNTKGITFLFTKYIVSNDSEYDKIYKCIVNNIY